MTDSQLLLDYIDGLATPDELDRTWLLAAFLAPLGIDPDSQLAGVCEDIVTDDLSSHNDTFHMRPGGWRVGLGGPVTRSLLAGALLGAVLFANGVHDIPVELYPAVLPLLIDVERVKLSRRDRDLLFPLRIAAQGVEGMALSPHVLYNRLEPAVRAQLGFGDFQDLCDRLIEAGQLDDADDGDIRARAADNPAWVRVSWK